MKLVILPSAREDLDTGYDFYDRQEQGLGKYFFESLFSDIEKLKIQGAGHQIVFGYRRKLSEKFPYAIYYSVENNAVYVVAVLDCRRDPVWIRKRLKD